MSIQSILDAPKRNNGTNTRNNTLVDIPPLLSLTAKAKANVSKNIVK